MLGSLSARLIVLGLSLLVAPLLAGCDDDHSGGTPPTPTPTSTSAATNTPAPSLTPVPSATSTQAPSATATSVPSATPEPSATVTESATATSTATARSTQVVSATPRPSATSTPTLAPECEILNGVECLLPYPSSHFLEPADTATGYTVRVPQAGIPHVKGETQIPASMLDELDGFSPGSQIMMHFPQGVDLAASNVSRLLPAGCCGQPEGTPWIDTRTYDGRSLEADSPTVLLDADTGERVLHFLENDVRSNNSARRITFLRPARILEPGHRYIVAVRNLVAPGGATVEPELPFRVLRDGSATERADIEARRPHFEQSIFPVLTEAGIERSSLVLAFDFVVASDESLHRVILSMRDQAYAWLDTVAADPNEVPFVVENVLENDCTQPKAAVWRTVTGYFLSPLFIDGAIDNTTTPLLRKDEAGNPVAEGFDHAPFSISIPCAAREVQSDPPVRPLMIGHGLFLSGQLFTTLIPSFVAKILPWTWIAIATDWRGLSLSDVGWLSSKIVGNGESQLHNVPALFARIRQGMTNTLVLTRMAKLGVFNRAAAFQRPDGSGVFPGSSEDIGYFGISLGGVMGTYLASLTPDIHRFILDVPGVNFACMLERANPFGTLYSAIVRLGLDPMQLSLGLALVTDLWASAEPVGTVNHVTSDPLPGSGEAKQLFYSAAWLDKSVPNVCTEIAARSLDLPVLAGSIQQGLQQMPDVEGPVPSALVFHDAGELDILNPAHQAFLPPLGNQFSSSVCDPHSRHASAPATVRQAMQFLLTGELENKCNGLCDGDSVDERPVLGVCEPPMR